MNLTKYIKYFGMKYIIVLFSLAFFLAVSNIAYSQKKAFIVSLDYSEKFEKKSKRNLMKIKKWYMILNNDEIEFQYSKKEGFIFPELTEEQLLLLEGKDDVLIKIKDNKRCYIGLLPSCEILNSQKNRSVTSFSTTISPFIMYKDKENIYIHYSFSPRLSEEQIKQIKEIKASGKVPLVDNAYILNLRLIPCNEYKGEYDKGYEQYRLSNN